MTSDGVKVLVLAVRKKLLRKPMQALLSRLRSNGLQLEELDEAGMSGPVESWPRASVLIPLVSSSFPLAKVQEYAALRRPFVVNDLTLCSVLRDRHATRRLLLDTGVPMPAGLTIRRSIGDVAELRGDELRILRPDGSLRGVLRKPFVEKPVDADDHNVHIYYKGGGVRRLFRKVNNVSSALDELASAIRPVGDFVYEKFYEPRSASDIKVYAAGDYYYAEARKAPHVDGVVERDDRGFEVRSQVQLTSDELIICQRVTDTYGQFLNGFDLLRTKWGKTLVIDVNGWSFVKRETEFTENCAQKLVSHVLLQLSAVNPPYSLRSISSDSKYRIPTSRREIEH